MKGEKYFIDRLNELYEYSIMKYQYGKGNLICNMESIPVVWEICVEITGKIILILSSKCNFNIDSDDNFNEFSLYGTTNDEKWKIECENMIIYSCTMTAESEAIDYIYHCSIESKFFLKHNAKYIENKIDLIKSHLTNFDFKGLIPELNEKGGFSKNKFICNIEDKEIEFKLHRNIKDIKQLIDIERITYAVMSSMTFKKNEDKLLQENFEEIELICWFLSLINLNSNFTPMIDLYSDGELVGIVLTNYSPNSFKQDGLIDNHKIISGIQNVFTSSYKNFNILCKQLELNKMIDLLLEMQTTKFIEMKFATLIMCYELLLTKYLIYKGRLEKDIVNSNIHSKIRMADKFLKFIPKNLSGNDLREKIRNPLFHQGTIPFMNFDELYEKYVNYYDLFIRILFKIIEYSEKYISRINYMPKDV